MRAKAARDLRDEIDLELSRVSALAELMRHVFYLMAAAEGETHIRQCSEGLAVVCEVIREKGERIEMTTGRLFEGQ